MSWRAYPRDTFKGVGFGPGRRWVLLCLAAAVACSLPAGSAHAARAQPQADVAVMRETSGQIAANVIEAVDTALLRALGEVAGIRKPTLSPVDYGEVQLTVGCSDESNECLSAITHIAEADAVVVRHLIVEPDGAVALRVLYFDEAGGPAQVQVAVLADHVQELAQAVPDLVRRLFEIPEPAAQGARRCSSPGSAAPAAAPPAASTAASDRQRRDDLGAHVGRARRRRSDTRHRHRVRGHGKLRLRGFRNTRVQTPSEAQNAEPGVLVIEDTRQAGKRADPGRRHRARCGRAAARIDLSSDDASAEATHASVR